MFSIASIRHKFQSSGPWSQGPGYLCVRVFVGGDDRVPARGSLVCPLQHADPRCWRCCSGRGGGQQGTRLDFVPGLIENGSTDGFGYRGKPIEFIGPKISKVHGLQQCSASHCGSRGGRPVSDKHTRKDQKYNSRFRFHLVTRFIVVCSGRGGSGSFDACSPPRILGTSRSCHG